MAAMVKRMQHSGLRMPAMSSDAIHTPLFWLICFHAQSGYRFRSTTAQIETPSTARPNTSTMIEGPKLQKDDDELMARPRPGTSVARLRDLRPAGHRPPRRHYRPAARARSKVWPEASAEVG